MYEVWSQSLNDVFNAWPRKEKYRSDDIKGPDVISVPRGELVTTSSKSSLRDSFFLSANRVSETQFPRGIHVAVITPISSLLDSFMKIESIRLDFHVYSSHIGCHGGSVRILKPSLWGSVYNLKIEPQRLEMLEI